MVVPVYNPCLGKSEIGGSLGILCPTSLLAQLVFCLRSGVSRDDTRGCPGTSISMTHTPAYAPTHPSNIKISFLRLRAAMELHLFMSGLIPHVIFSFKVSTNVHKCTEKRDLLCFLPSGPWPSHSHYAHFRQCHSLASTESRQTQVREDIFIPLNSSLPWQIKFSDLQNWKHLLWFGGRNWNDVMVYV